MGDQKSKKATASQVGGNHYKDMPIQPVEFIDANKIPFIEGCVIKYVVRHEFKGGVEDINKAIHFLQLLKELRYEKLEKGKLEFQTIPDGFR